MHDATKYFRVNKHINEKLSLLKMSHNEQKICYDPPHDPPPLKKVIVLPSAESRCLCRGTGPDDRIQRSLCRRPLSSPIF